MSRVPDWREGAEEAAAWDSCWLGPHFLPGRVKCKTRKERDLDIQKQPGVDGAKHKNKGIKPATVEIELEIYENPAAFAAWCETLPKIDPHRPGSEYEPHEIINPEPNHMGVNVVIITDIESESPTSSEAKKYRIKCQQYFPRPKTTKTKTTPSSFTKSSFTMPEQDIVVRRVPNVAKNSL